MSSTPDDAFAAGSDREGDAGRAADPRSLRQSAIAALARRDHSRAELRRKLLRGDADAAEVDLVLDALEAERLLSDRRFAEGMVRSRAARYGSQRVAGDLRMRGVGEVADELVAELKAGDEERARQLWSRKFGTPAADAAGRARQMRFLQARGFPAEVIRRVVPRAASRDIDD